MLKNILDPRGPSEFDDNKFGLMNFGGLGQGLINEPKDDLTNLLYGSVSSFQNNSLKSMSASTNEASD